jgi:pyrroloquinoline quinone biosynthesis protein B
MAAKADPNRIHLATSLGLVTSAGATYLFEATPDLRPQLDRLMTLGRERGRVDAGRKFVDGVFITHAHMGHYTGLLHLGFEAAHANNIPLFASPTMVAFLQNNQPWRQLFDLENLHAQPISAAAGVELEPGVLVTPVTVPHRDELSDTVAWRIAGPNRTMLFLPDCDPWLRWAERGFSIDEVFADIDLVLLDATFFSGAELPGRDLKTIGHPLVRDSVERFGQEVRAGSLEIVFIHLNHSNPLLQSEGTEAKSVREAGFQIAVRGQHFAL